MIKCRIPGFIRFSRSEVGPRNHYSSKAPQVILVRVVFSLCFRNSALVTMWGLPDQLFLDIRLKCNRMRKGKRRKKTFWNNWSQREGSQWLVDLPRWAILLDAR